MTNSTMSTLTSTTCRGRLLRIDTDFIQIEAGYAFWLPPTLAGTEGIQLGDEIQIEYDLQTMQVLRISKAGEN